MIRKNIEALKDVIAVVIMETAIYIDRKVHRWKDVCADLAQSRDLEQGDLL
jgi:hypothetical protein